MDVRGLVVTPVPRQFGRFGILAAAAMLLAIATWLAGGYARERAQRDLARQASATAKLHAALLRSELEKHRSVPLVLAEDVEVRDALDRTEPMLRLALDRKLERLAQQTRSAVVYVLDKRGVAIAASNWRLPTSFVGANYSFRPYFREALNGRTYEHFALGAVSRHPGLFIARRVEGAHGPLGVVVVKVEFDGLEQAWRGSGDLVLVTEQHGVVLVTSVAGWRFATLSRLVPEVRAALAASGQFGTVGLDVLPLRLEGRGARLRAQNGQTTEFVAAAEPAPIQGWSLHLLTPVRRTVAAAVLTARIAAASLGVLLLVLAWLALRYRDRAAMRAAAQLRTQVELEARVAERTHELRDANGRLVQEMEERRRVELRRQELQDELAQANRLAILGQIATGVAHEINQPVAAIRTFAESGMILLDRDERETAHANLGMIASLTERIGLITGELRAFSRKTKSNVGIVSLDDAIQGALLLVGSRARAQGVALIREDTVPGQMVRADRVRLEQIFLNLFQNALDALGDRSDAKIRMRTSRKGSEVRIEVGDNGPGIDPAVARSLFTPFATSKEHGLGLGLVISRDLATEFGGDLVLDEARPSGACFTVVLRAAK